MFSKSSQQSLSSMQWQDHVNGLVRSGLSRAEYCRRHNLSYHALTYWCRKLRYREGQTPVLVQVPEVPAEVRQPANNHKTSGVTIRLNNEVAIELSLQFSPDTLKKVLCVLEGR